MPKWDYCGQSNLLGSEGKEEDGEDIAYCKTARVLNKHLLRRPINARSRARHGEEGWRYEPRFVSKSQWYLRVEIWACQLGRKSQERRKGERERWGRGRREKGWSRILKEIWRSELPGSNGKDAVWMPVRSGAEFVWSKLCIWSKLCLWMASPTRWTWVWASSGTWWWTGRPGIATVHGVTKSWTGMSYWTELMHLTSASVWAVYRTAASRQAGARGLTPSLPRWPPLCPRHWARQSIGHVC